MWTVDVSCDYDFFSVSDVLGAGRAVKTALLASASS